MDRRRFLFAVTGAQLLGANKGPAGRTPPLPPVRNPKLKAKMRAGDVLLGIVQTFPGAHLAATAERHGCDFIFVDAEHGHFEQADLVDTLRRVSRTNMIAMIRLSDHDLSLLSRFIEAGADAILVPHVSTFAEAEHLAAAFQAHPETWLVPVLESAEGADNADIILDNPRVDAVFVGPHDLSTDLGRSGDFMHPCFLDAVSRIERAAKAHGKLLGTVPHGPHTLGILHQHGHRLFVIASDHTLLDEAAKQAIAHGRSAL